MKETHQNILIHKLMKIIMNDHRYIGCVDIKNYGLYMSYILKSVSKQIVKLC